MKQTGIGGLAIAPLAAMALATVACSNVRAQQFSAWDPAQPIAEINTPANEGCPMESADGLSLYFASNRSGGLGGNDIWVAHRPDENAPWRSIANLGQPVNSNANDICPTPLPGHRLLFVSERPGADPCAAGPGRGDLYIARRNPAHGWGEPESLGCAEGGEGPNTVNNEITPSLVETPAGTFLYYSSDRNGAMDIYVSELQSNGRFGTGKRVDELSGPFDDRMPNVSKNGLTIVFSSNRPMWSAGAAFGGHDIYMSTRSSIDEPWSEPVNLGAAVNTSGNEVRPSLSWDMLKLYFGRDGDVYLSTRLKLSGRR